VARIESKLRRWDWYYLNRFRCPRTFECRSPGSASEGLAHSFPDTFADPDGTVAQPLGR